VAGDRFAVDPAGVGPGAVLPPSRMRAREETAPPAVAEGEQLLPRCGRARRGRSAQRGAVGPTRPANWETWAVSTTRRPLGTGPRPTEEQSPIGDCRERGRTAAERAAVEPPALAVEDEVVQARPPGRRRLGTGVPASTFGPSFEGGF